MLNTKLLGSVSSPPSPFVEDVFSTYLYTGNGSTQTITNGVDLAGKGGLVWIKRRDLASNYLATTVGGTSNYLVSNTTNPYETSVTTRITSFNADGFSIGSAGSVNNSGTAICSWTFREQAKFMDVVTFTGTGASPQNVPHNLGSVPGMMIVKRTDTTDQWNVYHRSLGNTKFLLLSSTAAEDIQPKWGNTTPTSTVFTVGGGENTNTSGGSYIAYLFAHDAGGFGAAGTDNVISCGTFTSGASVTSVNLGYEPQYVLIKRSDDVGTWIVFDTMRGYTVQGQPDNYLSPNNSDAEVTGSNYGGPTATGFDWYPSGEQTYIYMAIRRPMKPPTSGTQVFTPVQNSNFTNGVVIAGQSRVDMSWSKQKDDTNAMRIFDRLRGSSASSNLTLLPSSTAAETNEAYWAMDQQNGVRITSSLGTFNYINYFFTRATGVFDQVCYTGTGSARTVAHNLGVAPELMIVKRRNTSGTNWLVYATGLGATKCTTLNTTDSQFTSAAFWNDTTPTSSVFTVGTSVSVNNSADTYVAYLFATLAGVSKVGSYTGNGSSQTINCGFTAGARFVMVRRVDDVGNWVVWDTARGIVSGNDPYLLLNSTAAEVTTTDAIDPDNSGFIINRLAAIDVNENGGSYIFMAIA